jgi:hypothetical protein
MNGTLKIIFAIMSIIILLAGFMYAWVKSRKIGPIVEDHFMDWKEFGVEVTYRSPEIIIEEGNCGRRERKEEGGIIILYHTSAIALLSCSSYQNDNHLSTNESVPQTTNKY